MNAGIEYFFIFSVTRLTVLEVILKQQIEIAMKHQLHSACSLSSQLADIVYPDTTPKVTFSHDHFVRVTAAATAGVSSNHYAWSHTGLLTNEAVTLCGSAPSCEISRPHDHLGRPAGLT